jgi:ABC-2 type transport system ATP-binding protein
MKGLFKLLLQYVFASESLFFILLMPLILLGIMGEALIFATYSSIPNHVIKNAAEHKMAVSFIAGISGTSVISSALFLIPITIVDFKNSVLMKRIGATNVKP